MRLFDCCGRLVAVYRIGSGGVVLVAIGGHTCWAGRHSQSCVRNAGLSYTFQTDSRHPADGPAERVRRLSPAIWQDNLNQGSLRKAPGDKGCVNPGWERDKTFTRGDIPATSLPEICKGNGPERSSQCVVSGFMRSLTI